MTLQRYLIPMELPLGELYGFRGKAIYFAEEVDEVLKRQAQRIEKLEQHSKALCETQSAEYADLHVRVNVQELLLAKLEQERDEAVRMMKSVMAELKIEKHDLAAQSVLLTRVREVLDKNQTRPQEMQSLMRKHGLKLDDLDDSMQKLAFTFYTELVEVAEVSRHLLAELEEGKGGEAT